MDVRPSRAPGQRSGPAQTATPQANGPALQPGQIERILGERQQRELLVARGFRECRGLSRDQLEDIYQETTLALLHRHYRDEKHLRTALRKGIKQRALNLHRDERRRQEILAHDEPGRHALERARSPESDPEQIALARQDRLIVTEFLAELTTQEQRVFWLSTEGRGYNSIAKTLAMSVNEARNTLAACERKRERFQLLHDSGRLCGYRAATIEGLLAGQATSEQLARLALAHLQSCSHCRAEHHTNARRLRRAFQDQAAALLPPILLGGLGRLGRAGTHARVLAQRLQPSAISLGPTGEGVRERTIALLAGGGAGAKLAAGVMAVAVIAGGTLTATHTLEHHHKPSPSHAATHPTTLVRAAQQVDFTARAPAPAIAAPPRSSSQPATAAANAPSTVPVAHAATSHSTPARREPGGFAYLGVPTSRPPPPASPATPTPQPAPTPTPAPTSTRSQPQQAETQTGGGPFSP